MPDAEYSLPPLPEEQVRLFAKSLPLQVKLHELRRALGSTEGLTCLDVGVDNGILSHYLRRHGGRWHTAVVDPSLRDAIRALVGDNVDVIEGQSLPFKKKVFDVVVVECLEKMPNDEAFVEECHKILKPDGRLVIDVARFKSWTLLTPLRRMLGVTPERFGMHRAAYTESQLFRILKHGFDVHSVRSYSRFFLELVDLVARSIAAPRYAQPEDEPTRSWGRSLLAVLYWLAFQLDLLCVFSRGHRMIAVAKRRLWRPRMAPVLVDGRSITEAVLSRASG